MGVGNHILTDDGFGVHVANQLLKLQDNGKIDSSIEIIDGGAAGIDILYYLENQDIAIFIDSIIGGKEPGYVYNITLDDLKIFKEVKVTSLHDLELTSVLKIAKEVNKLPKKIYLIGIEPLDYTKISMESTPKIKEKIPKVIEIILDIIQKQS